MQYEFSEEEINRISQLYGLEFENKGGVRFFSGHLKFDSSYKGYRIIDNYECVIAIPPNYPTSIPSVFEVGKRTEEIAKKWNISDLRDLHSNPKQNKSACLCVRQEEKNKFPLGSDFAIFMENLVIPYFYGLSYFNEKGKWPWKEYSHGALGILEFHSSDTIQTTKEKVLEIICILRVDNIWRKNRKTLQKLNNSTKCLCGSDKLFHLCHTDAFNGMLKLKSDISNLKLNTYKLFKEAEKIINQK